MFSEQECCQRKLLSSHFGEAELPHSIGTYGRPQLKQWEGLLNPVCEKPFALSEQEAGIKHSEEKLLQTVSTNRPLPQASGEMKCHPAYLLQP